MRQKSSGGYSKFNNDVASDESLGNASGRSNRSPRKESLPKEFAGLLGKRTLAKEMEGCDRYHLGWFRN